MSVVGGVAVIWLAASVMPQLTTNGRSPNACRTGSGSGADALRMNRSDGGGSTGPVRASTARIAGTAFSQVMRRSASSPQNPVRWNRASSTSAPPDTIVASTPTTCAFTWKRGSGLNPRSSAERPWLRTTSRATTSRRCSDSSTPFGRPLDPEVKRSDAAGGRPAPPRRRPA